MAASCKLPLGNPNFKISLELMSFGFTLGLGPRIILGGHLHSRDRRDFPLPARQSQLFLFHVHSVTKLGNQNGTQFGGSPVGERNIREPDFTGPGHRRKDPRLAGRSSLEKRCGHERLRGFRQRPTEKHQAAGSVGQPMPPAWRIL